LDKDDDKSEGEEPNKDTKRSGDFHSFSNGVAIDSIIDKLISTNKLHNYPWTLKALAIASL
jgi:hypothetical protein